MENDKIWIEKGKVHNCDRCEYIRMYDYDKRVYYCDHSDRTDDMGNNDKN